MIDAWGRVVGARVGVEKSTMALNETTTICWCRAHVSTGLASATRLLYGHVAEAYGYIMRATEHKVPTVPTLTRSLKKVMSWPDPIHRVNVLHDKRLEKDLEVFLRKI